MLLLDQEKEKLYNLSNYEQISIRVVLQDGLYNGLIIAKASEETILCRYIEASLKKAELDVKAVFHEMVSRIAAKAELYVTPLQDEIGLLQSNLLRKHIFSKDSSLDSEINRAKYWQRNKDPDRII